jgi:hypothetical protein
VVLFGVVQTSLWSFVVVRFVWELGLGVWAVRKILYVDLLVGKEEGWWP